MKVFALLYEPANYTIDRNNSVYKPLGIRWGYLYSRSFAGFGGETVEAIAEKTFWLRLRFVWHVLRKNDVVILNGYSNGTNILFFILNFFLRKPIGIDSDTPLSIPQNPIARVVKHIYLNILFRRKWCYGLAGGTGEHKDLFRYYGMKEKRIFLSPMMVDNAKYARTSSRHSNIFRFLYVGRIVDCKNIRVLLDAFKSGFANNSKAELLIVGDGEMLPIYKDKYGDVTNIHFEGKKSGGQLVSFYHNANVLVLPSSYEPWGLVVNEAMAAGLPALVSDKVGARTDLVEGKGTGFVFAYNDVDELKSKMRRLYEDKQLWQQCSMQATKLMSEVWNYDLYRRELERFLKAAYVKGQN